MKRMASWVMVLVAATGCPNGTPDGNGNANSNANDAGGQPVVIPATTRLLEPGDLAALASVNTDLSQLVFSASTPTLATLAADDVLVCGVHGDLLPYGMLRKVITVTRDNGQVVVETGAAALTEAIERGRLDQTIQLDAGSIVSRLTADHGRSAALRMSAGLDSGEGFVFAFNDYELYDADGDASTRDDRVWADGNFSFSPELSFTIDIDGFELQALVFEIGAEQQSTLRVTAGRQATFSETEVLEEIELTPITFSIGPIPVVFVPRLLFRVGVDGTLTADLTAAVQADATVSVGFGYQNGGFGPTADFDSNASFDSPNFRDGSTGTARVWIGPRAELAAYGIAGVYGELRGFVRAEVDATANPWWTLSAGVEAVAGVFIEVFDLTIAEYETPPLEESIELAQADGPAPSAGAGVVTWARSFGGVNDNIDHPLAVLATDDGGCLVVGGTNSFTPTPGDLWVIKLDRLGAVSWQRAYADLTDGIGVGAHPEGGFVLLAGTVGTGADRTSILHIDANGDPVWAYRYESDLSLAGYQILTRGDTLFIGGVHGGGAQANFWIAALDLAGQPRWSMAYGGTQGDELNGLAFTTDGGLIAVGPTHSFGVTNNGIMAVQVDAGGQPVWEQGYDGSGNEWIHAVIADDNGSYRLVGRTGSDALVIRLSGTGTVLSAAVYDAGSPYEEAFGALGLPDGGLLIAGNTGLGDDSDLWLLRLTAQLEVLWTTSYGGPAGDEAGGSIQRGPVSTPLAFTDDGGFFVIANTRSFGGSFYDAWIQRVSESGTILYDAGSNAATTSLAGSFRDFAVEPVPTTTTTGEVPLMLTPVELQWYTPAPRVTIQATP